MNCKHLLVLMLWALLTPTLSKAGDESKAPFYGFIENKGQVSDQNYQPNPAVKYLLNIAGLNVQLRAGGFSYDAYTMDSKPLSKEQMRHMGDGMPDATFRFHRVDITLVGANANATIEAAQQAEDYLNYYNSLGEFTGVHHFGKVTYKNIYNGIDLEFLAGNGQDVKYNFIVHPGADVSQIKMQYTGADKTWLHDGRINMTLAHGNMQEHIPASYLATGESVDVKYRLAGTNTFGYAAGSYDKTKTLVIDPMPDLAWGTYYGGSGNEYGRQIAVNGSSVYAAGFTSSTGSIATSGTHQSTLSNSNDGFIAKFNLTGARQWGTYYGGAGDDFLLGITTSSGGDIIVTGQTTSTTGIATTGAHQTTHAGGSSPYDGIVARFTSAGARTWGTYYGGTGIEYLVGTAIDGSGNIYVVGTTSSTSAVVPSSGFQNVYAGGTGDGILIKFNGSGVRQWATYTGTDVLDEGNAVAVDGSGGVFMCGTTNVPTMGYITSVGAHQTIYGGGNFDYFVGKFDAATGGRYWGTLYGGPGDEIRFEGRRLAVDPSGNVILVGGSTSSTGISTSSVLQSTNAGNEDAIIVKFNTNGVRQWGTYYGSFGGEVFTGVATDASGNIYLAGVAANSNGLSEPTSFQLFPAGGQDVLVAKLSSNGFSMPYATYWGDGANEYVYDVAIDAGRHIYVTGGTETSSGGYLTTTPAHQASFGGGNLDAFVGRIQACETGSLIASATVTNVSCYGLSDGTATINVSNGTPPYKYNLTSTSTFQTSNVFTGLSAGTKQFYILDDHSCENQNSVNASITQPAQIQKPVITGQLNPNNGDLETYSTPNQAGVTFTWVPKGGTVQTGQGTNQAIIKWTTSGAQEIKVVAGTASCGDSASLPINVKPVSVNDVMNENGIQVYPNPAGNFVTISLQQLPAEAASIRLYNAVGRLVMEQPLQQQQRLDISALPAGIYQLQVGNVYQKLTKL